MVKVQPFRAWRPAPDKVHLVGSRSYVTYGSSQLTSKLRGNPYSFLHVIHPDMGRDVHLSRHERFHRVKRKFNAWCREGIFQRDATPTYTIYEQSHDGISSCGVIAAVSVEDYLEGRVKVHEQTLSAREEIFTEYLEATGMNAEPVLLAAPDMPPLEALIARVITTRPMHDFSTTDRVRHRLWVIRDTGDLEAVTASFAALDALYIADGHHRSASSALLAQRTQAGPEDPRGWCLAFIVPRSQLHIHNFDRVITDLGRHDLFSFLEALKGAGRLVQLPDTPQAPPEHGTVHIHVPGAWYAFTFPEARPNSTPQELLDAERTSRVILGPLLGVADVRTDDSVSFVPGILGIRELEDLVAQGRAKVAIHLRPVDFDELTAVADSGGTMPPKSTYIEPKLRSGVTIYSLEDN